MATLQVPRQGTRSGTFQAGIVMARTKRRWSDAWQWARYLTPLSARRSGRGAPGVATFEMHYGRICREDRRSAAWYEPLKEPGYAQVVLEESGGRRALWTGYLDAIDDEPFGSDSTTGRPRGVQQATAFELSYLLSRQSLNGAWALQSGQIVRLGYFPAFNRRAGRGARLAGNRSAQRYGTTGAGAYVFATDKDEAGAGLPWSHLDILEHILYFYGGGLPWRLTGHTAILSNLYEVVHEEGQTPEHALNHLVSKYLGLGWRIAQPPVDDTPGRGIEIEIFSGIGDALSYEGITLPAARKRLSLSLDRNILVDAPRVMANTAGQFDRVVVEGGLMKSQFTLSVPHGNLVAGWSSEEEEAYKAGDTDAPADAEACDLERSSEKFEKVYQALRVPDDWNWTVYWWDGATYRTEAVAPALTNSGQLAVGESGGLVATVGYRGEKHFLRNLLERKSGMTSWTGEEYKDPLVLILGAKGIYKRIDSGHVDGESGAHVRMMDSDMGVQLRPTINHILAAGHVGGPELAVNGDFTTDAAGWTLNQLTATGGELRSSYPPSQIAGSATPSESMGIQAGTTYRVVMRLGEWGGHFFSGSVGFSVGGVSGTLRTRAGLVNELITAADTSNLVITTSGGFVGCIDSVSVRAATMVTNTQPEYDWRSLIATVAVETDQRLRAVVERPGISRAEYPRTLVLRMEGAEMWYVVPGTITDIENGRFVYHAGGLVRDDSAKVRQMAVLAYSYYARKRAPLSIGWRRVGVPAEVGDYLTRVDVGGTRRIAAETPVTELGWDFASGRTFIETELFPVAQRMEEFPGLSSPREVAREIKRIRRQVEGLEEGLGNLPVRWGAGGGGASSEEEAEEVSNDPYWIYAIGYGGSM